MLQTINFLYDLYAFTNKNLFQNALPLNDQVVITIERETRSTEVLGTFCKPSEWFSKNDQIPYRICLSPFYLDRTPIDVAETMLHEMCHLACALDKTEDPGPYHNDAFRTMAESHGLRAEKVPKKGYARTTLKTETVSLLEKYFADNHPPRSLIYKKLPPRRPMTERIPSFSRHTCPICKMTIKAPYPAPPVPFQCPLCKEVMQQKTSRKTNPRTF